MEEKMSNASSQKIKSKPFLVAEFCKACGRCIEACHHHCITEGIEINPLSGVKPVQLNLDECTSCNMCIDACPEPYGLRASHEVNSEFDLQDPNSLFGRKQTTAPVPVAIPDVRKLLPTTKTMIMKGNYASAMGALFSGCRHVFGYPITPSTEGAEFMAKIMPELDGVFYQAPSEVATVNLMYGCGGAGQPAMTFTSSPGFSLMMEGMSYMIGAEVPGVFVNIMRGGPGLGNIAPEQSDIKMACHGLGHGNTRAIVLAPATPQEMLDLTQEAFRLTFKYRNPVIILGDGYLGQITGKVQLPKMMIQPGIPDWAVYGDALHRGNLINSIFLAETDLSDHNIYLNKKYEKMHQEEQRAEMFQCEDAEYLVIACNTPAQMSRGAIETLRRRGIKAGLFRPITLWPFPINDLMKLVPKLKTIVMVEASDGQLENEVRLALSYKNLTRTPHFEHLRTFGGMLPQQHDVVELILNLENKQ